MVPEKLLESYPPLRLCSLINRKGGRLAAF